MLYILSLFPPPWEGAVVMEGIFFLSPHWFFCQFSGALIALFYQQYAGSRVSEKSLWKSQEMWDDITLLDITLAEIAKRRMIYKSLIGGSVWLYTSIHHLGQKQSWLEELSKPSLLTYSLFWTSVSSDELLTAEAIPIVKPVCSHNFLFPISRIMMPHKGNCGFN